MTERVWAHTDLMGQLPGSIGLAVFAHRSQVSTPEPVPGSRIFFKTVPGNCLGLSWKRSIALATARPPGGHGTEYGLKFPTLTGPKEAQAWVDDRIAEGSDYIKIIYENGGDTGHGGRPSIDKATLQALIAAAHAHGKLAIVHIHSERQAMDAIESGSDGLAHRSHMRRSGRSKLCATGCRSSRVCNPHIHGAGKRLQPESGQRILDDPKLSPFVLPAYRPSTQKEHQSWPGRPLHVFDNGDPAVCSGARSHPGWNRRGERSYDFTQVSW